MLKPAGACRLLTNLRSLLCLVVLLPANAVLAESPASLNAPDRQQSADGAAWSAYIEPFYGTAIIDQIRGSGIGTGELISGRIDGSLREGRLDDGVAGLALRLERDIGDWNTGLNLTWRYRTDWDLTAITNSIQSITNIFSDVQTSNATLFVGRHWQRGKHRFAIDAGVGLVRNRIESEYLERAVPGVRGQLRFEAQTTHTDFAWDATLSWHRALNPRWRLGARYRFSSLGDFATGDFPGRPAQLSARHRSHDVLLSLGRRF